MLSYKTPLLTCLVPWAMETCCWSPTLGQKLAFFLNYSAAWTLHETNNSEANTECYKTNTLNVGGVSGHVFFFKFIPFSLPPLPPSWWQVRYNSSWPSSWIPCFPEMPPNPSSVPARLPGTRAMINLCWLHNMPWCGMKQCEVVWHGMVWHGKAWT